MTIRQKGRQHLYRLAPEHPRKTSSLRTNPDPKPPTYPVKVAAPPPASRHRHVPQRRIQRPRTYHNLRIGLRQASSNELAIGFKQRFVPFNPNQPSLPEDLLALQKCMVLTTKHQSRRPSRTSQWYRDPIQWIPIQWIPVLIPVLIRSNPVRSRCSPTPSLHLQSVNERNMKNGSECRRIKFDVQPACRPRPNNNRDVLTRRRNSVLILFSINCKYTRNSSLV